MRRAKTLAQADEVVLVMESEESKGMHSIKKKIHAHDLKLNELEHKLKVQKINYENNEKQQLQITERVVKLENLTSYLYNKVSEKQKAEKSASSNNLSE